MSKAATRHALVIGLQPTTKCACLSAPIWLPVDEIGIDQQQDTTTTIFIHYPSGLTLRPAFGSPGWLMTCS